MRAAGLLAPGTSTIHLPFILGIANVCVQCPYCYPHLLLGSVLCPQETQSLRSRSGFKWRSGVKNRINARCMKHSESQALGLIHTHPIPSLGSANDGDSFLPVSLGL